MPEAEAKEKEVEGQEAEVEPSRHKDTPGQETKADAVSLEEDSAEIEGCGKVGEWIGEEEGEGEEELDGGTDTDLEEAARDTEEGEVGEEEGRGEQENVHLDGDA